ncbi:hypothetical protein [Haladaptatus sp. NG-SE-30]
MAVNTDMYRRNYLRGIGAVGTAGGLATLGIPTATATATTLPDATVSIDPSPANVHDWPIDDRIFGKFIEHNGRDVYPGFYADHIANGSFEVWNEPTAGDRTAVLYRDTPVFAGVAYPWEPFEETGTIEFSQQSGGRHGREAEPDLESGAGVPADKRPVPAGITTPRFQRVSVKGKGKDGGYGGVRQRTALPDHRTLEYDVSVSVRGKGSVAAEVCLEAPDGTVLAHASVPVSNDWERHEVGLQLSDRSGQQYQGSPFGEYVLSFVISGHGDVDLDWVMLMAGDAVNGKFNPTTIDLLKEFNVTSLRWPGGNFASQYHWRDGVGPLQERPIVPNVNWGGLERNYFGTNEFLEFCEIAGIKPLINVGFWSQIPPVEAAEWVEYVNGDQSTELGQLRADHGYPTPWNVTAWQVGNEVYGTYQIGNKVIDEYAAEFQDYDTAMKAVDDSIEIDAVGIDPMYTDFHDGSGVRNIGDPPIWNTRLFDIANGAVEGVDIHRYTRGIVNTNVRQRWLETNETDPVGYNEVLVNFPKQFDVLIEELRSDADERGIHDLRIDVGEWNLQPVVSPGWPRAGYPTMAHATFMAGMFNTMLRQGETVTMSHMRDNSLFWRPYPIDFRPAPPGDYTARFYAEPFERETVDWKLVPVAVTSPTFTMPKTGIRIRRMENVPFVDATAIIGHTGQSDDEVIVYVTNGSLTETFTVELVVAGWPGSTQEIPTVPATLQVGAGGDPFARQTSWSSLDGFTLENLQLEPNADGNIEVTMPPASVGKLSFTLASS